MRLARLIGDLDHEFYDDERQREVWNEASAVGLQSAIFLSLIASAVLPWAAGITGAWTASGLLIAITVVSVVVTSYARVRSVDAYTAVSMWRLRSLFVYAVYSVAIVGIGVRLYFHGRPAGEMVLVVIGAVIGAAVAAAAITVAIRRKKREEAEFEAEEEF